MTIVEPIRDGLLDMWAYKARTILQTMGIMLGSASVIVTIALLLGGRNENKEFLETTGGVTTLEVRKSEGGRQRTMARDKGPFGVTMLDLDAVREAVEPLGAIVYASRRVSSEMRAGTKHEDVNLWGVTPEYSRIEHLIVATGRYVSAGDIPEAAPVVVLGSKLAEKLFPGEDPLGKSVSFGHAGERAPRRYVVVGVLAEKWYARKGSNENWLSWMNDLAYAPLTTILARETGGRDVGGMSVRAPDIDSVRLVKQRLDEALLRNHRGVRNYTLFDRAERLAEWESQGIMYDAAIGGAGAISLLVGGIVIMNILLASLTQRIREVGIRKALGARNLEIFIQFLTESIIVAGMGGVGGAALGSSVSGLVSTLIRQELMLTFPVVLAGVAVSMTVGLVFGVYPAIRAARLDPVVALRYE